MEMATSKMMMVAVVLMLVSRGRWLNANLENEGNVGSRELMMEMAMWKMEMPMSDEDGKLAMLVGDTAFTSLSCAISYFTPFICCCCCLAQFE